MHSNVRKDYEPKGIFTFLMGSWCFLFDKYSLTKTGNLVRYLFFTSLLVLLLTLLLKKINC